MKRIKLLTNCKQFVLLITTLFISFSIGCKKPADTPVDLESSSSKNSLKVSSVWGCANHIVENTVESPLVKISTPSGGSFNAGNVAVTWSFEGTATSATKVSYEAAFTGVDSAAIKYGVSGAGSLSVAIKRYANQSDIQTAFPHLTSTNFPSRPHGYLIETSATTPNKVTVHAITEPGIVNGLGTLESLMQQNSGAQIRGLITDWPDLKWRGFHLVLKDITTNTAKAAIDRLRRCHYNMIILSISNNVNFQTLVDQNLARDCAWSTSEFMDVVNYAKKSGMNVIPELRFLSHQQDFMSPVIPGPYASLMWPDGSEKTYNVDSSRVYTDFVFPYIDDVIAVMNPATIHIGHDEVYHINGVDNPDPSYLTGQKFMNDVIAINNYITAAGKKTMMWGDMLIKPSEFPDMHPGPINGNTDYVNQRVNLPSNIAIVDWHYREKNPQGDVETFPSMLTYASNNEVYGATFDTYTVTREFARYTANNYSNSNVMGMVATSWARIVLAATNNPNATDDWVAFDAIVKQSGEAFWNKPAAP